jgi:ATP-dependent Clp protease ATP-binding subunit ClpC
MARNVEGEQRPPIELGPGARAVMVKAEVEADRLFHPYLGTEHLFLGFFVQPPQRVNEPPAYLPTGLMLTNNGYELEAARDAIEFIVGKGEPNRAKKSKEQTPLLEAVIRNAQDLASKRNSREVDDLDLFAAFLQETEGIGAGVLESFGGKSAAVRLTAAIPVYRKAST